MAKPFKYQIIALNSFKYSDEEGLEWKVYENVDTIDFYLLTFCGKFEGSIEKKFPLTQIKKNHEIFLSTK
jgi:hypothetical protein